jgi:tetraacyldisaccharide 4'-kinase
VKKNIVFWVEKYLYNPSFFQKIISFLLLPLSGIYCVIVYLKYKLKTPHDFGIKVISIGNLTVGGSGKTPLVTAIAKEFENPAIILRGYGRKSKGLIVVKQKDKLLCDVDKCGDEALVYATKLDNAIIIVSEDRKKGILKAKELGAGFVLLDDGYSKHDIKKLDIVIDVETKNRFCLPSGGFREKIYKGKKVVLVKEGVDFERKVILKDKTDKMSLITAIAKPQRLNRFLPDEVISKHYFPDHYDFKRKDLENIYKTYKPDSFLVTLKDYVKLKKFNYNYSLLDLELSLDKKFLLTIKNYLMF